MLAYLLIIVIAFGAVAFTLVQLVGEYLFSQRIGEDTRRAEELSEEAAGPLSSRDAEGLYELARGASSGTSQRVMVLDAYGVVQADARSEMNGTRFSLREVQRVLRGEQSAYGYYSQTGSGGADQIRALFGRQDATGLFASAIRDEGGLLGVLVYISRAEQIYDSLAQIQRRILMWIVLVTLAVLVMSLFVLRRITGPIAELNEGIQAMTKGDFSARVHVPGKNEFAQLGQAFNVMTERLERLDHARSEFVSNASHELKTPLASIKIIIQTIQEGGDAMEKGVRDEFLNDVDKEINRMTGIVSDLLTLVNIDSGGMKLNREVFSLREMLEGEVKRLLPMARERGIEMEFVAKASVDVDGDKSKLAQVAYNIIDNALKYTKRNGRVTVELSKNGKKAVVRISDTGIGIPKDEVPHIFERFYRVDKARARETGGTGLGLSIVQQILTLHEGMVDVESEENVGSTFTITLPVANR